MKYTSKSLKYVFANFGYLVLFGLFPAVFLAYSLDTATVGAILRDYFTGSPYASFSDIFHAVSIFNFHSVSATIADVLSVILAVTCVAMMMAFMEKHMRIGKKTWTGLFSKLNDNLLSTLGITLLFACLYELWALITSALLLCVSFFGSKTVIYILSVIVWFGTQIALLFVVSLFYLWLPCLQIQIVRSAFLFVSAGDGREADDCAGTVCFDDDCRNFNRSRLRFCSVGMAETCIELRGIRRADPVVRYPYAGGVFRQGAVGESGREKLLFRLIIFLLKIFRRKKAESVWRRGFAAFYEEHL